MELANVLMTYDQVKNFHKTTDIDDKKFQNRKTDTETSRQISIKFAVKFTQLKLKFQNMFQVKFLIHNIILL